MGASARVELPLHARAEVVPCMSLSFLDRVQLQRADEQVSAVTRETISATRVDPLGICPDCGGHLLKKNSKRCMRCSREHHRATRVYPPRRPRP